PVPFGTWNWIEVTCAAFQVKALPHFSWVSVENMTVCLIQFFVRAMFAPKSSLHFDVADSTQLPPSVVFVSSVIGIFMRIEVPMSARDQKVTPLYADMS